MFCFFVFCFFVVFFSILAIFISKISTVCLIRETLWSYITFEMMVFKIILMIHTKKCIYNLFKEQRSDTERDLTSFINQQILQKATSISASSCSCWHIFSVYLLVKLVDVFTVSLVYFISFFLPLCILFITQLFLCLHVGVCFGIAARRAVQTNCPWWD